MKRSVLSLGYLFGGVILLICALRAFKNAVFCAWAGGGPPVKGAAAFARSSNIWLIVSLVALFVSVVLFWGWHKGVGVQGKSGSEKQGKANGKTGERR